MGESEVERSASARQATGVTTSTKPPAAKATFRPRRRAGGRVRRNRSGSWLNSTNPTVPNGLATRAASSKYITDSVSSDSLARCRVRRHAAAQRGRRRRPHAYVPWSLLDQNQRSARLPGGYHLNSPPDARCRPALVANGFDARAEIAYAYGRKYQEDARRLLWLRTHFNRAGHMLPTRAHSAKSIRQ